MVKKGYKQTEVGVIPEDWKCVPLLSKCSLLNGLTYNPENVSRYGLLVIRSSNIQGSHLVFSDNVYVDLSVDSEKLIKKDDIIVCVRNGSASLIGKCAKAENDYFATFGSFMAVLRGNCNDFIFQLLQQGTIQKHISKNSGATINQITNGDLKTIFIPFPSDEKEQYSIAEALSDVDGMISSLEKLIAKYKSIKTACLQQMFPQNGGTVPRMRLPGFTGAWEQRKLGEMGQTYTGLSGKTKDDFGHGQARFVTYMNVFSNPISNPEMTEPIEIDPKQNEVEVGDVFFTTSSETPEEVGMSSVLLEKRGKTYLNSFCFGFRPSEKIDSYYLAYMLRSESARAKITLLAQDLTVQYFKKQGYGNSRFASVTG